jgi:acetyltransferase-like isoleucine patch superfamily enzyme
MKYIAKLMFLFSSINNRLFAIIVKSLFHKVGKNFVLGGKGVFAYENISIGDDVYIGPQAYFMAGDAPLVIGNKVIFGPKVTIITGDHRFDEVGKYICEMTSKREGIDDAQVTIEDDVWIGCGVTILKGVTIGTGSIIAAGSMVSRSIPPNSIYVGSNRILLKERFDQETYERHKAAIMGRRG